MDNNQQNDNRPNGPGGAGQGPNRNRSAFMVFLAITVAVLLGMALFNGLMGSSGSEEISYDKFLEWLDNGYIKSVTVNGSNLEVELKGDALRSAIGQRTVTYYTGNMNDPLLVQRLEKAGVTYKREVSSGITDLLLNVVLTFVLPMVLLWIVFGLLMRKMGGGGGGIMGVGKNKAKVYVQKETGITFKDVAGQDEAKESLQEVVDFLHNPMKYASIGAKLPKGALLVGPPGTGKTLLAKAVAGEAKVPFFSLSGSDFIELYVGVGASRVRDLFKEATKNAPCIIFIDEIDAIGRSRDNKYGGGNEEREQTLNQLLSEMDGFDTSKGILVLGATNRPEILDKALLRPGRFDRRIIVDKPDLKGRVEILKVHAKDVHLDESVDLDAIALATSGAVGADLANMINEAAIMAVQHGREYVSQKDLFAAVEQVLVGKEKKDRIMSREERKIVSYHEVGHALISALQKNSEPVQKITIVPRTMGALGYVMHVPEEEKYLQTKEELHDRLVSLLGGRAAEELIFGNVTTGAANDIEQATNIATNMITRFGMSDRFGLMGLATVESEYLGGGARLTCSDRTAADVDTEVMNLLKQCYDEAKEMLAGNRELMDKLAAHLIEKETISGKEFMKIYREEKGLPDPEEKKEQEQTAENSTETTVEAKTEPAAEPAQPPVQAQEDAQKETQNAVESQIKDTSNFAELQEQKTAQNPAEPQVQNLESAPKQPTSAAGNSEGSPRGRFSNVPSDRV